MITRELIDDFVSSHDIAFVGASRNEKKFGYAAYKELKAKGYNLIPVHNQAETIQGDKCYPDLKSLPRKVDGALIVLHPKDTEKAVKDAVSAGIKRVWLQQGAESENAIKYCKENGVKVVHNQCVLMFAEPVASFHKFHRFFKKLFGRLPK